MSWTGIIGGVLFAGLLVLAGQDLVQRLDEASGPDVPVATVAPATGTATPASPERPVPLGEITRRTSLDPGSATTFQLSYGSAGLWLQDRREGPDPADALAVRTAAQHDSVAAAQDGTTAWLAGCCPASDPLLRLEVRASEPAEVDRADWRGVTDLDLRLPSGQLAITHTGTAPAQALVRVVKGRYRVRVSARAQTVASPAQPEFFDVVLWPSGASAPLEVHKPLG